MKHFITPILLATVLLFQGVIFHKLETLPEPSANYYSYRGQDGLAGLNGADGNNGKNAISKVYENTHTVVEQVPLRGVDGQNGKDAEPCTTSNDAQGNMVQTCPDGSKSVIEKPKDGTNGKTPQIQKNSITGNLEWRLTGEVFWKPLYKKCEIQNNCETL
jgi:hypothetical protein